MLELMQTTWNRTVWKALSLICLGRAQPRLVVRVPDGPATRTVTLTGQAEGAQNPVVTATGGQAAPPEPPCSLRWRDENSWTGGF